MYVVMMLAPAYGFSLSPIGDAALLVVARAAGATGCRERVPYERVRPGSAQKCDCPPLAVPDKHVGVALPALLKGTVMILMLNLIGLCWLQNQEPIPPLLAVYVR